MPSAPLIPRRLLFGNASRLGPKLSPDGRSLSWLAPVDGVMNIWLAPIHAPHEAEPLTRTKQRPIYWHAWSPDSRHVLFLNDLNGDENYHLYVVDPATGELRDVTPYGNVRVELHLLSADLPGRACVAINDRDPSWHDLYSIDLVSGERELVFENREHFGGFLFDWQGNLRLASRMVPEKGGRETYRYANGVMVPQPVIPFEDDIATRWLCFNRAGTHFNMLSSIGRNTSALLRIDMATGAEHLLAEHPKSDLDAALLHPMTFEVEAIACEPARQEWIVLDPSIAPAFELIHKVMPDREFFVSGMSDDNQLWIVMTYRADEPAIYHLLDRRDGSMQELFRARPDLEPYSLTNKQAIVIRSRDGLDLVSYLSLPPSEMPRPKAPLPMVLLVHGGPWARDSFGYDPVHQMIEAFFFRHMGGHCEPVGQDFDGSTHDIRIGSGFLHLRA